MMKTKMIRALLIAFVICLMLTPVIIPAGAEITDIQSATVEDNAGDNNVINYANPDTGYEIELDDQLNVLTETQREALAEIMKALTEYTHVYFLTTDKKEKDIFLSEEEADQATYPISLLIYSETDDVVWFGTDCDKGNISDDELLQEVVNRSGSINWYAGAKYGFTALINRFKGNPDETALNIGSDADSKSVSYDGPILYTNPDTGYQVIIMDELDLLTDTEEASLKEDMIPVTEFGNVAFWTTDENTYDYLDQSRLKRKELFEYDSASIFMINMKVRKLAIQSYGKLYDFITDSRARSITDNVSRYATNKEYYTAASKAFQQIYNVAEGENIPEPMKITSYVVISLILGLILTLCITFSSRFNPLRKEPSDLKSIQFMGSLGTFVSSKTVSRKKIVSSSSSGCGGGGCSSCGGGGSSCGGGGCGGGGGGGCGGGGGSSF